MLELLAQAAPVAPEADWFERVLTVAEKVGVPGVLVLVVLYFMLPAMKGYIEQSTSSIPDRIAADVAMAGAIRAVGSSNEAVAAAISELASAIRDRKVP